MTQLCETDHNIIRLPCK